MTPLDYHKPVVSPANWRRRDPFFWVWVVVGLFCVAVFLTFALGWLFVND